MLKPSSRSTKLYRLYPGTKYLICVLALGTWATRKGEIAESRMAQEKENASNSADDWEASNFFLSRTNLGLLFTVRLQCRTKSFSLIVSFSRAGVQRQHPPADGKFTKQ